MVAPEILSLSTSWIEEPEQLWPLQDEWLDLASRTQAEVYLRPEWVRTWWDHFGTKHQLQCLIIRDGKRLAGLLPFCIEPVSYTHLDVYKRQAIYFLFLPLIPNFWSSLFHQCVNGSHSK